MWRRPLLNSRICIYLNMYIDDCGESCKNLDADYTAWDSPGIGRSLVFMAVHGFIWLFILFLLESDSFRRAVQRVTNMLRGQYMYDGEMMTVDRGVTAAPVEDSDVAAERQRIVSTPVARLTTTDVVVMHQLTKFYGSFLAVDRLSVGMSKGEWYGQLQTIRKTYKITHFTHLPQQSQSQRILMKGRKAGELFFTAGNI